MRLGHRALSQTVSSFSSLSNSVVWPTLLPLGMLRLSHFGKRWDGSASSATTLNPPPPPQDPAAWSVVAESPITGSELEGREEVWLMSWIAFLTRSEIGLFWLRFLDFIVKFGH